MGGGAPGAIRICTRRSRLGFALQPGARWGEVGPEAAQKGAAMAEDTGGAPDPDQGWSRQLRRVADARIVPSTTRDMPLPMGVYAANGEPVPEAVTWRHDRPVTVAPATSGATAARLAGRWLWGGVLFDHFGHFVMETAARLWAAHGAAGDVRGLCLVPRIPGRRFDLKPFQADFLAAFGITLPVTVLRAPTLVDELVVPGQGLGLGRICRGTAEMRAAVAAHLAPDVRADGPERLYVARLGLPVRTAGILGEDVLARHLEAEGYQVFCPEQHDIATQIARYRAARQILVADGSAGHLLALVARPDQRIGYILRRSGRAGGPEAHIAAYSGARPVAVDAIARQWLPVSKTARGLSHAEPDFPRLQAALAAAGFVRAGQPWPALPPGRAEAILEAAGLAVDFRLA